MIVSLAFVSNALFNFFVALLVAKFLGPAEYGRFAIAWASAILINTVVFDWIRLSAVRFYSNRARVELPAVPPGAYRAVASASLNGEELGKAEDARHWYDEALKVSHDHPEVLCNLGFLAFRAGDYQQAVERFQDAAHLAVGNPLDAADYWFNAGTARERLKQYFLAATTPDRDGRSRRRGPL